MSDIDLQVRKLRVKQGDVLVFQLRKKVRPDQWRRVAAQIVPAVPPGVSALLVPYGMTIEQIRVDDIVPTGTARAFRVKGPEQ